MGEFRTSLVFKVLGKLKKRSEKSYIDLASEFFVACLKHQTSDRQMQNPWGSLCSQPCSQAARVEVADKTSRPAPQLAQQVLEYDSKGNAVGVHRMMLMSKGYAEQSIVKCTTGADPT